MNLKLSEELFKTVGSETRLRIMHLLDTNMEGLRFSEISANLEIHPSTLEDHLKRLLDGEVISHYDGKYFPTLNTSRFLRFSDSLSSGSKNQYLATHQMVIEDTKLREEFWNLDYIVLTDLLSIVSKAKASFTEGISYGFIGGEMDMKLEQSFFELWQPNIGDAEVDVVFTEKGVQDIVELDVGNLFMQAANPLKTNIYVIDECTWAIGGSDKGGLLYLTGLTGHVDYQQALCFESEEGINWLRNVFLLLKAKARKMEYSEIKRILST